MLLLATYMNSLFRTGVPPPSHLIKTGFLKVHLFNMVTTRKQKNLYVSVNLCIIYMEHS